MSISDDIANARLALLHAAQDQLDWGNDVRRMRRAAIELRCFDPAHPVVAALELRIRRSTQSRGRDARRSASVSAATADQAQGAPLRESITNLSRTWSAFRTCARATVGVSVGIALPVVIALAGAAVDYATLTRQSQKLQAAADAAALAAARELSVSAASDERVRAVAEGVVRANVRPGPDSPVTVTTELDRQRPAVRVAVSQGKPEGMSTLVLPSPGPLRAAATATVAGNRKICVLALEQTVEAAVRLAATSKVSAQRCDVQSNSRSPGGLSLDGGTTVSAVLTCSAGGITGAGRIFGQRLTDCPAMSDPLAGRQPPPVGECKTDNKPLIDLGLVALPHVLTPGTYCGGLRIGGASVVLLTPGVYVIKDGPLLIDSTAIVTGLGVGFYFTGTVSDPFVFRAAPLSVITFTAPTRGPLAGVLFFEDRGAPALRPFEILSTTARTLLGTFYLPQGRFVVRSNAIIADRSAYTVIIARRLELDGNPELVLNTNYRDTDVPVPPGIAPTPMAIRLIQ